MLGSSFLRVKDVKSSSGEHFLPFTCAVYKFYAIFQKKEVWGDATISTENSIFGENLIHPERPICDKYVIFFKTTQSKTEG